MPEYLAPGVYVEETSFRAKSIEGVSTSTTAFVGPTRKGPIGDTPELLTSFADFERIYGGLEDLGLPGGVNYLAHAVRSYFDNGGARLYVSRVYQPPTATDAGVATSANLIVGQAAAAEQARFVARTPGALGNGTITVRMVVSPASVPAMERAPEGTLVRTGAGPGAIRPAVIVGGLAPFNLANNSRLLLTVGDTEVEVTVVGQPAVATAANALTANVNLPANSALEVTVDGVAQRIAVSGAAAENNVPRATVLERVQAGLTTGTAALDGNRLQITSAQRGRRSQVLVSANPALGFAADVQASGASNAANNVDNLRAVTAAELNALLAAGAEARASQNPEGRLVLSTTATGGTAALAVRSAADSAHAPLGLTPGEPATGRAGTAVSYLVKRGTAWEDSAGALAAPATLTNPEFVTLTVLAADAAGESLAYDELGFDSAHPRWVGRVLAEQPTRRADALENLFAMRIGSGVSAFELRAGLFTTGDEQSISLTGGSDGAEPILGVPTVAGSYSAALGLLEKLEDVSIVAAPGHSAYGDFQAVQGALIGHAEKRRAYRIAVLDTPADLTPSGARAVRSLIDSTKAALYYPWVVVANPLARPGDDSVPREIKLPPSGFVCGIYARNDVEKSVAKAPANEIVRGALRFEVDINFAEQEALNPLGINCLRFLSGRGLRVWGARTISSDPEWKYVNVRRYFNYLESSIDRSTQWAVFENNGERLWANLRETVGEFLYNEWVSGSLLGATQQEAYFVRCDRSTMTQNDLDNGRLICLVGVAALKPAEFVIFRVGQKTADARS